MEEHAIEIVVLVLTGVSEEAVEVGSAFVITAASLIISGRVLTIISSFSLLLSCHFTFSNIIKSPF